MKIEKLHTMLCVSAITMALTASASPELIFGTSILPKTTSPETVKRNLPTRPETPKATPLQARQMFIGWNESKPSMPSFEKEENAGEKMDSIVGHYLDGKKMSKQTFEYTETGRPLKCMNYLVSQENGNWMLDGYYEYEYDASERVVTATKVSTSSASMKVTYEYEGDSPVYREQTAFVPDTNGEWLPYQKGEYQFDINYNTTQEIYSYWSTATNEWIPVMKTEAEYDEESRLTSYFPYVWDDSTSAWIGDKSNAYEGQKFEYTMNGDDAFQADFTWEDGAWLEYKHIIYTYNDAALLTECETLYWHRENQDWNGGDGYGEWGDKKYNTKDCYEYDEYGRVILNNFYRKKKTPDYRNTYRVVYEYNELEDGETESISTEANIASDGTATTGRREIIRNNRFGGETYYAILKPENGEYEFTEEEYRYYMPGYNWYLGFESFRYEDGVKIPTGKEEFFYSDDFNPEAGYQTPYEGRHYVRTTDGLALKSIDSFTWGPRDVITDYVSYDCLSGQQLKVYGWDVEYDFSADCSKIFMWPDGNKGKVFYENKNLSSNEYYNPEYEQGSNEWNKAISSHFDYYYSSRGESGITTPQNPDISSVKEEIARYDSMGRVIIGSHPGINVIVYSDGTVKKVIL